MLLVHLAATVASLYTCSLGSQLPPGWYRLMLVTPAMILLATVPLYLTIIFMRGGFGFIFGWLSTFKLASFAFNRGPLAQVPGWPLWQFFLFTLLPMYPNTDPHPQQPTELGTAQLTDGQRTILEVAAMVATTAFLQSFTAPLWVKHCFYAAYIWLLVAVMMDSTRTLLQPLLGVRLHLGMNNPFASTSIREFWGRRYNLMVRRTLRDAIYKPILEGRLVPITGQPGYLKASTSRKLLGMTAAFLVSGLMHQLMLWYQTGIWYRDMLFFFLAQPALVVAQEAFFSAIPAKFLATPLGTGLRVATTLGLLLWVGELFFWKAFDDMAGVQVLIDDFMRIFRFLGLVK